MTSQAVVVKIGTGAIIQADGTLDFNRMYSLCSEVSCLAKSGRRLVLVVSGASAAGRAEHANWKGVPKKEMNQLWFAVGQPILFRFYHDRFAALGIKVAQLLLSRAAFGSRMQYFSIRDSIRGLMANAIVPIIVDNEVLHKEDPEFSDNDHLAAYIGGMLSVERVIFLTWADGVYKDGDVIPEMSVDQEFSFCDVPSPFGTSGFRAKIGAAKLLSELGIDTHIANGRRPGVIGEILKGAAVGTRIRANAPRKASGIQKWLCAGAVPKGTIKVSQYGAIRMREREGRSSLLARGIVQVIGKFEKGDVVSVIDEAENLLGFGITKYGHEELTRMESTDGIIVIHADYFFGIGLEMSA